MLTQDLLSPRQICDRLETWAKLSMSLTSNDILIRELGFVNKNPDSTIDYSFRADLALANGRLVGFEIKSGADNLKRWESQSAAYLKVFDELWLCCHGKHLQKAMEMTPSQVGILLVDDFGTIAIVRKAKTNKSVNTYDLSGLLWREELDELCTSFGLKSRSSETKKQVRERLSANILVEDIKPYVLARLKYRKGHMQGNYSLSTSSSLEGL
jgi:hypothetical protein